MKRRVRSSPSGHARGDLASALGKAALDLDQKSDVGSQHPTEMSDVEEPEVPPAGVSKAGVKAVQGRGKAKAKAKGKEAAESPLTAAQKAAVDKLQKELDNKKREFSEEAGYAANAASQ